jgi:hypothetical protein
VSIVMFIVSTLSNALLALRLMTAVPALSPAVAYDHAAAANAAATRYVSPELLLGIAFVESRYDPTATSRVERGVRHTGAYPSTTPPYDLDPGTSLYCGPLQTYASSWSRCLAARDLASGYATGADEIGQWLRDPRVRGDVTLALAGHGCGNAGVMTGGCNTYPARVLAVAAWIAHPRPAPLPRRTNT